MDKINFYIGCFFGIVLLCCFPCSGFAEPFSLTGKAGIFIPSSMKMRKIFNDVMPFIGLEGSYQFSSNWEAWVGVGYIFAEGNSTGCALSTKIDVVPFTLGIKRFFPLTNRIEGFFGLGGLWTLYRDHDYSKSVHQHISSNAFGAIMTVGCEYRLRDRILIRFFGEYMYQRFDFSRVYSQHFTYRHDVDMSGTKIGIGFTYAF